MTGPSGSGKTTLLTLIGGPAAVQEGRLHRPRPRPGGASTSGGRSSSARQIGFIFQHHNLFSSLSARRERPDGDGARSRRTGREMNAPTRRELLERLGLGDRLDYLPVAALRAASASGWRSPGALVNRPALVLADEPTAALDAESGETVMALLRQLADGPERTTVLIVTHDQRLIDHADRIVNMVGGRIVSNVMPAMTVRILKTISGSRSCRASAR